MNCHLCGKEIADDERYFSRDGRPFVHTWCVGDKVLAERKASEMSRIWDGIRGEHSRQTRPGLDSYDRR